MKNIGPATNFMFSVLLIISLNESQCCGIGLDEMVNNNINIQRTHLISVTNSRQFI
jgi:hypothetical protein